MAQSKNRKPLFERLRMGLAEGVAHARGELTLRTIAMAKSPPAISAKSIMELRERSRMSQAVFASLLNVSAKTVQSWEQGHRKPSQASLRLIEVFAKRPDVLCELVGMRPHSRKTRQTPARTRPIARKK